MRHRPIEETLRIHLSTLSGVDAAFMAADTGSDIIHVFVVVPEFESRVYAQLDSPERKIEILFPNHRFEFHVRAHQGRSPSRSVPFDAIVLFQR